MHSGFEKATQSTGTFTGKILQIKITCSKINKN